MPVPPAAPDPAVPDLDSLRAEVAAALEADDTPRAIAAIRAVSRPLAYERGAEYREFVTSLPADIWQNDPALCCSLGGTYRSAGSSGGSAALAYYRAAEVALARSADPSADNARAAIATGYAAALRAQGQLHAALVQLDIAIDALDNDAVTADYVERTARLALERGMVDLDLGRFDSARDHFAYALGLAPDHLTRCELLECLGGAAVVAYTQGELAEVDAQIARAAALDLPPQVLGSGFAAPLLAAQLLTTIDRHSFDDTRSLLARLEVAAVGTEWQPFVLVAGAFAKVLAGSPIEALDLLHRARQEYRSWRPAAFARDVGEVLRAELLASLGSGNEAFTILSELDPGERHSLCPARYIAQQRIALGDLVGAEQALHACDALGELHSPRTKMAVQLLRGAVQYGRGELVASDINVDRALLTMARTGVRSPLRHVPASLLSELAARAIRRPQNPEVTRILMGALASTGDPSSVNEPLSERERLVLTYVERELTVSAIAAELFISPNTVKTHLRKLYRKLGVSTREEAIRTARSLGLHFRPEGRITP